MSRDELDRWVTGAVLPELADRPQVRYDSAGTGINIPVASLRAADRVAALLQRSRTLSTTSRSILRCWLACTAYCPIRWTRCTCPDQRDPEGARHRRGCHRHRVRRGRPRPAAGRDRPRPGRASEQDRPDPDLMRDRPRFGRNGCRCYTRQRSRRPAVTIPRAVLPSGTTASPAKGRRNPCEPDNNAPRSFTREQQSQPSRRQGP